jgi:hypothetical protein
MAIMLTKWERREGTDREALGNAAFVFCREQRATPGVTDCRFFWTNPDEVAVLAEAESAQVFDEPPKPEMNRAIFHLADMARQTATERWIDPRDGMEAYRAAGR